jgi:hypothetical protein
LGFPKSVVELLRVHVNDVTGIEKIKNIHGKSTNAAVEKPFCLTPREGRKLPVMMDVCEGSVSGTCAVASRNRTPEVARASMFGVLISE